MVKGITVMIVGLLLAASTAAYAGKTAVGVKMSSLGFGIEGQRAITETLGVRAGIDFFAYSFNGTTSNVDYDFEIELKNAPIILDWHPFINAFRMSMGILINGNDISAKANPTASGTFNINGVTYTGADVGTLKGKIDFNLIAPYLGFGWDTSFDKERGLGFTFELGAIYQGIPEADLSVTGPASNNAALVRDLAQEESDLQKDLNLFKLYPVISAGIIYRF